MKKIDEIVLPSYVSRNMFDCFEQQIITLCQLYRGDFWKLFLKQTFECKSGCSKKLEDLYEYTTNVLQCAQKEYGISIEERPEGEDIYKTEDDLVLTQISSKSYEYTKDIVGEGTHFVIVFGETDDEYIINDYYYDVSKSLISKDEFKEGVLSIFDIIKNEVRIENDDLRECLEELFSNDIYKEYEKICNSITEEYDYSSELIDFFTLLCKCCFRYAVVIREMKNEMYEDYLNECADVIEMQVADIQNSLYGTIKTVLKEELIGKEEVLKRLLKVKKNIQVIQRTIDQVWRFLTKNETYADIVEEQLKKYEDLIEEEIDINASVYELHDKVTVMFLLNFLEEENPGIEINFDEIKELMTYREYMKFTFGKLLMM